MNFTDFERAFSTARLSKYQLATRWDNAKSVELYKANLRFSVALFAVVGIFEIVLRNAIDTHYRSVFGKDWLIQESQPTGFLAARGCEESRKNMLSCIVKLGSLYSQNNGVANLSFGFWCYLFAPKAFAAAGSNLLKVFPKRTFGKNHTDVFNMLTRVNKLRNRIAHHEPLCFDNSNQISVAHPLSVYDEICELLNWLDFPHPDLLADVDAVKKETLFFQKI